MKEKKATKKVNTEVREEITTVDKMAEKAVKAEEAKEKKTTKKTADEKAEKTTKKTAEVKKTAKKVVEKKAPAKNTSKEKIDTKIMFQYSGIEVDSDVLLELAKADYLAAGGLEKNIKKMELYIKPEDNAAYYVVNGVPAGKVTIIA